MLTNEVTRMSSATDAKESQGPKVLVVDDDITARLLARQSLEPKGFEVIEAADGMEAFFGSNGDIPSCIYSLDEVMSRIEHFQVSRQQRPE